MLKIIKVTGNSLSPFFLPGDYVITWRAPRHFKRLAPGDIVVFNHDQYGLLIKKVIQNNPESKLIEVSGIHPASLSTDSMGKIPYTNILGKVLQRIHKTG
jgi:hypothetical protein